MFCVSCGKQLPDDARFCSVCGTPVNQPEKAEAPVPAEPAGAPAPVSAAEPVIPPQPFSEAVPAPAPVAPAPAPSPSAYVQTPAGMPEKPPRLSIILKLLAALLAFGSLLFSIITQLMRPMVATSRTTLFNAVFLLCAVVLILIATRKTVFLTAIPFTLCFLVDVISLFSAMPHIVINSNTLLHSYLPMLLEFLLLAVYWLAAIFRFRRKAGIIFFVLFGLLLFLTLGVALLAWLRETPYLQYLMRDTMTLIYLLIDSLGSLFYFFSQAVMMLILCFSKEQPKANSQL